MQFLLLLVFGLVCWQNAQSRPPQDSLWPEAPAGLTRLQVALFAWGSVVVIGVAAGAIARIYRARLRRAPWRRGALLSGFSRARHYHGVVLLAAFLALLYYGGWGRLVEDDWTVGRRLPGAELIMLSPLLAAMIFSWEEFYRLEKAAYEMGHLDDRFLGKWDYLVLQLRNNLLIVVPPACLWLVQQTIERCLPPADNGRPALLGLYFLVLALTLVSMPLLLRVFLGLRPLAPGPLRQRLEETGRRLHFRYGNLLVWDTHRTMANALISGFLPWPRYVVLTDRLLEELTPEEIEAVFGHEVGHVRHHHMGLYVLFCLASLVALSAAGGYVRDLASPYLATYLGHADEDALQVTAFLGMLAAPVGGPPLLVAPVLLADAPTTRLSLATAVNVLTVCLVAIYFVIVFGILSRYCERQADLFGSRATSSDAFVRALEKVALVNGMPRHHAGWFASWRHPSIAERVEFVRRASADPRLELRFHLSLRIFKLALAMSLPCVLGAVWWFVGPEKVWELVSAL